jgi:hypothetical protein
MEKKQLPVNDQDKDSPLCDWIVLTKQGNERITVSIPSEKMEDDEEDEEEEDEADEENKDWIG